VTKIVVLVYMFILLNVARDENNSSTINSK
jgi:hypothetical protein